MKTFLALEKWNSIYISVEYQKFNGSKYLSKGSVFIYQELFDSEIDSAGVVSRFY